MSKQFYWLSEREWKRLERYCRAGGVARIGWTIVG